MTIANRLTTVAVVLLALSPTPGHGAEKVASATTDEGGTAIDPEVINKEAVAFQSAGERVDQAFEEFARAKGIAYGAENPSGQIYFRAKAPIDVDPTNSQWGKARVTAFEKALLEAQTGFVRDNYGKQVTNQERQLFEDQSDGADQFPTPSAANDQVAAIVNKALALGDAVLSKHLNELGVDPEQFRAKPPEQRKKLFEDALRKKTLERAIGDMAGLVPVQTFEGVDDKGTHVIGVVVMYSPKLRQLADDTRRGKVPLLSSTPKKQLREYLPSDPAVMADQFGLRVVFNENGEPCLLSYGQWSHNYTGSDERTRERRRESAKEAALKLADSYITLFQAGKLTLQSESETGEEVEEAIRKDSDGNVTNDDITRIIDRMNKKVTTTATAELIGRGTLDSRIYKHPNGQEIAIVARAWTVKGAEGTRRIRDWKSEQRKPGETHEEFGKKAEEGGLKKGLDQMNPADF